ncbi:5-formyltetrahydrofolate cyclo-ligase [Saccharopolyspora rectivirgula]|uniref:5-formyltetrahydrofolate cyclo-ligase n=1 Tax=Saccharopolyspora rectivirgula TaxID=28042 RepID=UPI0026B581C7
MLVGLLITPEPSGQPYSEAVSWLGETSEGKAEWRSALLQRRRELDETTRSVENDALISALVEWARERAIRSVGAYVPVKGEPGSTKLLDGLQEQGCRVLLPVVASDDAPLDWAVYTGRQSLQRARFGLLEPTGERLGPEAIAQAQALLVPALAVDRSGVRLGRGAGYYDRSLPLAAPQAVLIGVVRDDEFVEELPAEPHDVRMTAVVTPKLGVRALPV